MYVDSASDTWDAEPRQRSLSDAFRSVSTATGRRGWRRATAFFGPGYLVAVGYMDPGNWATSLAGGSRFGYTLLVVALVANIMALILQSLCARLAIATGRDLAQCCRDFLPRPVTQFLWLGAETAIIATDIAEVLGTAIGFNLIFHIPLELGVLLTGLDVFLIMHLQKFGFRRVEAFVMALLTVIGVAFAVQVCMAQPAWREVIRGFAPTTDILSNRDMLYLALGILGATVMPHNLYLHSGLVLTRAYSDTPRGKQEALRFATLDSTIALTFAFLVNASILILAAATFHKSGMQNVTELKDAHNLLSPITGFAMAPLLFGVALLCCGLNSTVTATLAGQIVMEGFLKIRLPVTTRRMLTRGMAILPAACVTIWYGEEGTSRLLVLTQVILSLQLPFAVLPLIMFTASRAKMGELGSPRWLTLLAAVVGVLITGLNVKLLYDLFMS